MFTIFWREKAVKQFNKLPTSEQKKINRKILTLSENPFAEKSLRGEFEGFYRIRAWPYRILYQIDGNGNRVIIVSVAHRQGVYK